MANYDDTATVSGSVVSFSNGADDVPTKSLVVTIPPTLSGVSAVSETQTGRNLFDGSLFPITSTATSYYINFAYNSENMPLIRIKPNTQYTISVDVSCSAEPFNLSVGLGNGTYLKDLATAFNKTSGTISVTFSATSAQVEQYGNILAIRAPRFGSSTTFTATISNPMLEYGSTAHAYEPYQTPTQYTSSLGRTIYGGQVDIVNGEGTDGYAKDSMTSTYLSGLSSSYIGYEASTNYFGGHPTIWVRNWNYQTAKIRQAGGIGCVCNYFPVSMHNTDIINTQNRIYFDVNGKGISDVAGFIAFVQNLEANNESLDIVYELETKTDFTFEPVEINSRLGNNTMWSEQGDTELTYYKSGYGFTSVTVHKETPNGDPVVQTAKLHHIVYGGQADVVKGTCEPKNILDSADTSHTFTSGTNTRYTVGTIALKGGVTYTFSAYQEDALTSNTRNTLGIIDNGNYAYEYATGSNYHNQSGVHSMQYTPNEDKTVTLFIWVHTPSNDVTYSEFQVEKGSAVSDFAPYFAPFTFHPISIGTDEGENTLFANEGDSSITYRKAVD